MRSIIGPGTRAIPRPLMAAVQAVMCACWKCWLRLFAWPHIASEGCCEGAAQPVRDYAQFVGRWWPVFKRFWCASSAAGLGRAVDRSTRRREVASIADLLNRESRQFFDFGVTVRLESARLIECASGDVLR